MSALFLANTEGKQFWSISLQTLRKGSLGNSTVKCCQPAFWARSLAKCYASQAGLYQRRNNKSAHFV
jgi:hypothetical protein